MKNTKLYYVFWIVIALLATLGLKTKIEEFTMDKVVYNNSDYGVEVALPETWEGYKIIQDNWEGYMLNDSGEQVLSNTFTGPIIVIRHPDWTEEMPRQDIPVMVFTKDQWNDLIHDVFDVGQASMAPKALSENQNYVFALSAQYNDEYLTGFEEVLSIVENGAIKGY